MNIQNERQQASQVIDELYQNTFFQQYWQAIRKFIGKGKIASIWVSAAIIMSINLLLGVTVSVFLGETQFTTLNVILSNLIWVAYAYFSILLFLSMNTRMVKFLQLRFIKSLQYESHIHEFLFWANQWIGRKIPQLLFSLGFGIATAFLAFYTIYPSTKFSLGQILIFFINFFHAGVGVYSLLSLLAFVLKLNKWYLVLYSDDPASSPILVELSKELRTYILLLAFVSAILLILISLIGALSLTIILSMLIIVWIPILALFILGNQAFSQQITRVKHEKLEKLQSEIMKMSNGKKLDKETIAHVKSLMDYHDRVSSTRNSFYNSESFVNLIGSLTLPTLAAILSAIDVWQKIFGKP